MDYSLDFREVQNNKLLVIYKKGNQIVNIVDLQKHPLKSFNDLIGYEYLSTETIRVQYYDGGKLQFDTEYPTKQNKNEVPYNASAVDFQTFCIEIMQRLGLIDKQSGYLTLNDGKKRCSRCITHFNASTSLEKIVKQFKELMDVKEFNEKKVVLRTDGVFLDTILRQPDRVNQSVMFSVSQVSTVEIPKHVSYTDKLTYLISLELNKIQEIIAPTVKHIRISDILLSNGVHHSSIMDYGENIKIKVNERSGNTSRNELTKGCLTYVDPTNEVIKLIDRAVERHGERILKDLNVLIIGVTLILNNDTHQFNLFFDWQIIDNSIEDRILSSIEVYLKTIKPTIINE